MRLIYRIQERLADRVPFVQYPYIRRVKRRVPLFAWRHHMPLPLRLTIALMAVIVLIASTIGLGLALLALWALFWPS